MTATITTALVSELRQKTGAGVAKCKQALVATNGDVPEAVIWLRKQGVKPEDLSKPTGEGIIVAKTVPDKGAALVELLCQTDFAAKSARFRELALEIAEAVINAGKAEDTLSLSLRGVTVQEVINSEIAGVIKENIRLGQVAFVGTPQDVRSCVIVAYTHDATNKLGVLVRVLTVASPRPVEIATELAKDVALHVAGSPVPPVAISREDVPTHLVEAEKRFVLGQLENDKKPEHIKAKILEGKLNRFYQERVLLEQPFVKDETITVGDLTMKASFKGAGATMTVDKFIRMTLSGQ